MTLLYVAAKLRVPEVVWLSTPHFSKRSCYCDFGRVLGIQGVTGGTDQNSGGCSLC